MTRSSPFAGTNPQVISQLAIGTADDGFDLDGDGKPDNKLAAVVEHRGERDRRLVHELRDRDPDGVLRRARRPRHRRVREVRHLPRRVRQGQGRRRQERPGIGRRLQRQRPGDRPGRDRDRRQPQGRQLRRPRRRGRPNVPYATRRRSITTATARRSRRATATTPTRRSTRARPRSAATARTTTATASPTRTTDANGTSTACSPFDPAHPSDIPLDPLSFDAERPAGDRVQGRRHRRRTRRRAPARRRPVDLFGVNIPVTNGITLDLKITGATIKGDVVPTRAARS